MQRTAVPVLDMHGISMIHRTGLVETHALRNVDLRVDDHPTPIEELARLLELNDLYLTASTEEEKVPVTSELAEELDRLAREAGARDFAAWVGTENYEMRVAPDGSWIDEKVLAIIRGDRS